MKKVNENAPTNSMGASSSIPGSGAIDTYDPVLTRNNAIIRRLMSVWKKNKEHTNEQRKTT